MTLDEIPGDAAFIVPDSVVLTTMSCGKAQLFRDPAGMYLLARLVGGLRARGFVISEPKPEKTLEAASVCHLEGVGLSIGLSIGQRQNGQIGCMLFTKLVPRRQPILRRRAKLTPEWEIQWQRIRNILDEDLRTMFNVTSVTWKSKAEQRAETLHRANLVR